jgi:hypothetical protein
VVFFQKSFRFGNSVLNQIITESILAISVQKLKKSMAFKGRDPIRIKILIDKGIYLLYDFFNC